jgi:hypothetical protein
MPGFLATEVIQGGSISDVWDGFQYRWAVIRILKLEED